MKVRFIAGIVCPKCGAQDSVRIYIPEQGEVDEQLRAKHTHTHTHTHTCILNANHHSSGCAPTSLAPRCRLVVFEFAASDGHSPRCRLVVFEVCLKAQPKL